MSHLEGVLIDTSPHSASPQLTLLRYEREKVIIAAWEAAKQDRQTYARALSKLDRYHHGERKGRLEDWQKAWLRAKHPPYKEYHAFEPVPFFEDILKKHWAAEERKRVETLERDFPLLQPIQAWTPPPNPQQLQNKGTGKEKEEEEELVDENPPVDENATFREKLQGMNFPTYGEFLDFCYPRDKKEPDLMSFQ